MDNKKLEDQFQALEIIRLNAIELVKAMNNFDSATFEHLVDALDNYDAISKKDDENGR